MIAAFHYTYSTRSQRVSERADRYDAAGVLDASKSVRYAWTYDDLGRLTSK